MAKKKNGVDYAGWTPFVQMLQLLDLELQALHRELLVYLQSNSSIPLAAHAESMTRLTGL